MTTALQQAADSDSGSASDKTTGVQDPGSSQGTPNAEQPTGGQGDAAQATTTDGATGGEKKDATTATEEPKGEWSDIRERVAGGEDKILKRLARYGTLEEALKAAAESQNKLYATKTQIRPGDKAPPEEIKT